MEQRLNLFTVNPALSRPTQMHHTAWSRVNSTAPCFPLRRRVPRDNSS